MIDPQARRILDDLREHAHLFDLELPREGGTLGERLLDIAATGVIVTIMDQQDPDGNRWAELSESYAERKAKISPGNPISYLYGLMDDPRQIEGERVITADMASMTYGVTPEAKQEAEWFSEGNDRQPARQFYALTAESIARSDELLDAHFSRALR